MAAASEETPLGRRIAELIRQEGPIGIDRYMALCLGDPEHGYYTTRDPFGAAGDFVTAPEISQMFGELIGLWAAAVWDLMARPAPVLLVELGPGRGTLMADAWRAAGIVPGFRDAAAIHLVETSRVLRERQRAALPGAPVAWHDNVATLPEGPALIVANEFFDALPVRQVVAARGRWHERLVGLDAAGRLAFGLSPDPIPAGPPAPDGTIREVPAVGSAIAATLAGRLVRQGGALLALDYGHDGAGDGDTLQALRAHETADPLARPGGQDLTVHVDFAALALAGTRAGAAAHGPVTQAAFLQALGLYQRAEALLRRADARQADAIRAAVERLTDMRPTGMGALFKVLALADPRLPLLPGFDRVTPPEPRRDSGA